VRTGGDNAGDRGRDDVFRRRRTLFPTTTASPAPAAATATILRIRDDRNGRDHDEDREHLQIADPWSHSWPPIQLLFLLRLTRASRRGPFTSGVCDEKCRDRVDFVGHDLRAAADHKENQLSPLLARLLMDLEHPAERRVTCGADLRHDHASLFDLRIVAALRTRGPGPRHHKHDGNEDEAFMH
jgi:hypothetical protein